MALESRTLAACNAVPEQSHDSGDANATDDVPPSTAEQVGDAAPLVYKKGAWSKEEDDKLRAAVDEYGVRNWVTIEKFSGLARPAKNCRLRWLNYLRPNLKKYPFTAEEERLILHLHSKYGNSWSRIASKLPGRSDNEIKNFWHKRAKKCQKHHLPLYPTSRNAAKQQQTPSSNNNDGNNLSNDASYFSNYLQNPQKLTSFSNPNHHLTDQTTSQMLVSSLPHMLDLPFWQGGAETSSTNAFNPPQQRGQFTRPQLSPLLHSHSAANMQMPWASSPPALSPTSPMKLKISPSAPALYSVQMGPQVNGTASLSGFQVGSSPNVAPVLHPPASNSCFQSNLSIPELGVQQRNVGSSFSNPNLDLPPIQQVKDERNHATRELPSIQVQTPTSQVMDSCGREAESDSHWEIMDELREALARVRFLKRKLKQKRISKRNDLKKLSPIAIKNHFLTVNAPNKKSRAENMLKRILRRKHAFMSGMSKSGALQLKSTGQDNSPNKIQKRKNPEGGEHTQENMASKKAKCENSETKIASEAETPEKVSEESFNKNASISFQEQSHSIDIFAHLDSQNPVTAPDSTSWDDKLCSFEGLFNECSTLLQDSFLKGDLLGQSSETEDPLSSRGQTDAFRPVYGQSTTATLEKPTDDGAQIDYQQPNRGGYFNDSFGQGYSNSTEKKFTEDVLCNSNLLPNQFSRTEPHNSRYLMGNQIMEQELPGGEQFSFQTSSSGNSAEPSKLSDESTLLMHPCHSNELIDSSYFVNFEPEYLMKQECAQGQNPTCNMLVQNIWSEGQIVSQDQGEHIWRDGQMVSQDQTLPEHRFHRVVDPNATTHLSESKNCSNEAGGFRHTGEVHHGQQHDHMNAMSEELASLLEFFPTTMQSLEWYNYCNADPSSEGSAEFDKGLGFHMPSSSHPLIPTADYT